MSAKSKQAGLAGGLKGVLLVAALGVAYLVQKFTGIDILAKLKDNQDPGAGTVAESQDDGRQTDSAGQDSGDFRIPERNADTGKLRDNPPKASDSTSGTQPVAQPDPAATQKADDGVDFVRQQFNAQRSKVWVTTQGEVAHILPDDNYEPRHQQFLLELAPDLTVKVAHNIDDAPYVTGLKKGDRIKLQGRYEWNEKGGVIHFTHKADRPTRSKPGGWIEYRGKRYQ